MRKRNKPYKLVTNYYTKYNHIVGPDGKIYMKGSLRKIVEELNKLALANE